MAAEPTTATIPFLGMEVDLTDPAAVVTVAVSLIAGFTLFNMTDSIGAMLASRANATLGSVLGINPGTGQSADNGPGGV
ncbi:hypothetical protein [Haloarcula salina]|uniref:Uncharacterized protein n=1 Tax=Haloarcula salina TaxID=1429914 RepID=A0AA41G408_9EURY|nr:hypothetical protein [Haloarcula salina]MBV0903920.1 hypothetical protein [Haloarcula salina]